MLMMESESEPEPKLELEQETKSEQAPEPQFKSEPYDGQEYGMEGIQKIKISTCSHDVRIYQANGNKLSIEEYLGKNEEASQVSVQNDTLYIQKRERRGMSFSLFTGWQNSGTEIFIPKDFAGALEVETASGDIELNGSWNLTELQMRATSGDLTVGMIKAEKLQLDVTSGDIQFTGGGGRSFLKTISGDIKAVCLGGEFYVETGSGDVEMAFREITGQANVKSASGDMDIKIAADTSCILFAEAVSGDVTFNLHKAQILKRNEKYVEAVMGEGVQTDSLPRVVVQAVSGDIDIIG